MDLIKDRLAHILRAKNLTATQFAEMMQIQPSNVSHLLSGRNKPSLDFLIKLKSIFPEYSFDWIILGKKPITASESNIKLTNELFNNVEEVRFSDNGTSENHENLNDFKNIINDIKDCNVEKNSISKGLKQIIYIYDDHSFEIFEKRP